MHGRRSRRSAGLAVVLALIIPLSSCAVNPATGERQFSLISEEREIEMGREYDPQIVAEMGEYPDAELQAYIQSLGQRLAAVSERPTLPWTFRVVDDPLVNAFAVPGGFIYITRGILAHFNSEAELVAVLGHEIGHVTARHSVSQLSRAQLAQIGIVGAAVLAPESAPYLEAASAGLSLLFLKYGRDDERQADDLGLRYLRRGGYDPREMADVFEMLSRVGGGEEEGRPPEWLSTHPAPEDRRERIAAQIAALDELADARVRRDDYLRRLDGMVFGRDPRQGFFREGRFMHPELRFRIDFPAGWQTANTRQAVAAMSPREDAVIELTLADSPDARSAARAFSAREGIRATGSGAAEIDGLRADVVDFVAPTEDGTVLEGRATFIEYDGHVYRLLAYAPTSRWAAYRGEARRVASSFARLADPAVLGVQPLRLDVVRLESSMTLAEFAERHPGPLPLDRLALLNGVDPDAVLEAGRLVKRVVGEPVT